jgi:DNA invertase Pin-like site-specific DNA recombinase
VQLRAKVYSYLRFSDPKQAAGGSADRQREYAERWAAEHSMVLDDQLTLFDEGLSAYHQKHVTRGALGTFLRAVEDGLVPAGSILIVESLDRLSRAEPILAQAQLSQIVNAGITVVTASDNREYNRERLKAQPMDLVYSLLVMIRAHEESETKSKRVKAAIRRQCQGWIAGTYRGLVRNGHDPEWLRLVDGKFEPIPERVEAVKLAVGMYRQGHGHVTIMRRFEELGLSITNSGRFDGRHLYKLLRNRVLVGEKSITLDGEQFQLQGYYPAVLTEAEFNDLQYHTLPRERRMKGDSDYPPILTGTGITRCGYCGALMRAQVLRGRNRAEDGTVHPGHQRILCANYGTERHCPVQGGCSAVPIERAIIEFCTDQMNLSRLNDGFDRRGEVIALLQKARADAAELQARIDRLTDAMAEVGTSAALAKKLRDSEDEQQQVLTRIASLENDLTRANYVPSASTSAEWAAIAAGVFSADEEVRKEARNKARLLVADTFSGIQIYHRGFQPPARERNESGNRLRTRKGRMEVVVAGKAGGIRVLLIDRHSGAWRMGEHIDSPIAMDGLMRTVVDEGSSPHRGAAPV